MVSPLPSYRRLTAKTFRRRRVQLGFTAARMAKLCGVSSGRVVRKWEAEDNEVPEGVSRFLWLLDCLSANQRTHVIDCILGD